MSWGVISEMGYVAIQTTNLEGSIAHAESILGLSERGRSGSAVSLASRHIDRELVYTDSPIDAVDRIGLVAKNREALGQVFARVRNAGFKILGTESMSLGESDGFVFIGPGGFIFDIYLKREPSTFISSPHAPDRYGHVNLHPQDLQGMLDFFTRILDFKVSDVIGDDFAYFLRCNVEHHGVALIKGVGWLHHHAWQAQSLTDLGKLGDRLHEMDEHLLMGPVRHGAGHNMAAYYVEPSGAVVELYTDMEMIYDDDRPPIVWPRDDRKWATKWSIYDFTEFRSHGLYPAKEPVG